VKIRARRHLSHDKWHPARSYVVRWPFRCAFAVDHTLLDCKEAFVGIFAAPLKPPIVRESRAGQRPWQPSRTCEQCLRLWQMYGQPRRTAGNKNNGGFDSSRLRTHELPRQRMCT